MGHTHPELRNLKVPVLVDCSIWRNALGMEGTVDRLVRTELEELMEDYRVVITDWTYLAVMERCPMIFRQEWMRGLDALPRVAPRRSVIDIALQLIWELGRDGYALSMAAAVNASVALQLRLPIFTVDRLHPVIADYRRLKVHEVD